MLFSKKHTTFLKTPLNAVLTYSDNSSLGIHADSFLIHAEEVEFNQF